MSEQILSDDYSQKTHEFFSKDVALLAEAMQGIVIASQVDGKMIKVDTLEGWPSEKVGYRYTNGTLKLTNLEAGTLGVFPLPVRRMRQSLVSAMSGGDLGGCIRLIRASRFDPETERFVPMTREGDIANHFDLKDNQSVRLRFLDDSGILYFNIGEDNGIRAKTPEPAEDPKARQANDYLRNLISQ